MTIMQNDVDVVVARDGSITSSTPVQRDVTIPTNKKSLQDGLLASLVALKANIDLMNAVIAQTNATINSNPASAIKDCARANKDATRACIRLIKVELEQFQDADTGAA